MHKPIRRWWAPWRRVCSCGLEGFPCAVVLMREHLNRKPSWSQQTTRRYPTVNPPPGQLDMDPPLMTRGAWWRATGQ
ncbi:hypothetical protein [Rhizomonospora bruguierae]|uniref:hypothetical protein n=1 Tax=Rhizomonospora bruguierae TaxID=1581705 RepID=UPI001BCC0C2C|nr:hypothetical protein [Micromonospora sp. NBRC 107566]